MIVTYNICLKILLQKGISNHAFYGYLVYKLKKMLENLILVINLKRLLNVIKEWATTWLSCDSLHAWLLTQSWFIAMGQASDSVMALT